MFESIRGPSATDTWQELADELDASFESSGLIHREMEMVAQLDGTPISLDVHSSGAGKSRVTYTRMRAPCTAPKVAGADRASMNVEPSNIVGRTFRKITNRPGMTVEDPRFDDRHVVDGTSAAFVRDLLTDPQVRSCLADAPFQYFRLKENDPVLILKVGEKTLAPSILVLQIVGVVKDKARLRGYFSMFNAVLSRLNARDDVKGDSR